MCEQLKNSQRYTMEERMEEETITFYSNIRNNDNTVLTNISCNKKIFGFNRT